MTTYFSGTCDGVTVSSSSTDNMWVQWTYDTNTSATSNTWGNWTVPDPPADVYRMVEFGTSYYIDYHIPSGSLLPSLSEEASKKAKELLAIHLTEAQRKMLDEQSAFLVESELGRIYKIRPHRTGNVDLLDKDGKRIAKYCIHTKDSQVPLYDNMLVQKLMLETCEQEFLRIANKL